MALTIQQPLPPALKKIEISNFQYSSNDDWIGDEHAEGGGTTPSVEMDWACPSAKWEEREQNGVFNKAKRTAKAKYETLPRAWHQELLAKPPRDPQMLSIS